LDSHKAHVKVKNSWLKSSDATVEAFNSTMKVLEKRQELLEARMNLNKQADAMAKKLHSLEREKSPGPGTPKNG